MNFPEQLPIVRNAVVVIQAAEQRTTMSQGQYYKEVDLSIIVPVYNEEGNVELLYDEKEALSVADTSIIFEDEKKFVYKILDNNKIEKTEVVTGIRKEGNLEILEGLEENDRVIKEGLSRLSKGMTVKPIVK